MVKWCSGTNLSTKQDTALGENMWLETFIQIQLGGSFTSLLTVQ